MLEFVFGRLYINTFVTVTKTLTDEISELWKHSRIKAFFLVLTESIMATSLSGILAILCSVFVCSTAAATIFAIQDLYEVEDGGHAVTRHYDSATKRTWKSRVNLERLEVLKNDISHSLPFETCTEDKITSKNKHADDSRRNLGFKEVHQVTFILIIFGMSANSWLEFMQLRAGREAMISL